VGVVDTFDPAARNREDRLSLGAVSLDPSFLNDVDQKQQELYPGFLVSDGDQIANRGEPNKTWVFFSPLHHARSGLLTPDLVDNMCKGAKLLVVGAGCGDIERYLIKVCAVNPEQITAADIDLSNYASDLGVTTRQFDMVSAWSLEPGQYQHVLLPESLGMAVKARFPLMRESPSLGELREIFELQKRILGDGPSSISDQETRRFLGLVCTTTSPAGLAGEVIKRGLQYTAPGGDLRINGHCLSGSELAAVLLMIDRCESSVSSVSLGQHSMVIRRASSSRS